MGRIKTESQINNELGVASVSDVTEEHVKRFIQILPQIDREVAIEYIKNLPSAIQASAQITEQLKELTTEGIKSATDSNNASLKGYQTILDSMADAVKDGNYSLEEKQQIWSEMKGVASDMDRKDSEHKEFVLETVKSVGGVILKGALILGAFVFGAKIMNNNGDDSMK